MNRRPYKPFSIVDATGAVIDQWEKEEDAKTACDNRTWEREGGIGTFQLPLSIRCDLPWLVKTVDEANERKLIDYLREQSRKIAPDYPNIKQDLDPFEHLWAITSSYEGTVLANSDCHEFIGWIMQMMEWNPLDIIEMYRKHKEKHEQTTT